MNEEGIKKYFDEKTEETKRHFDVVAEGLKHEIKLVAEGVLSNDQKISVVQRDVNVIKDDIETIKVDIEFIKNELTQKVPRNEFAFLEKRVCLLETKVNQSR